jgi:ubiquinone/menaquinone biosynthesis C-methylase UbiE
MDYVSSGFPEVDRSKNAAFFFSCLETLNSMSFFKDYKNESFRVLKVAQGSKALDVGCGLGIDVASMATIVGRSGRVVGLDASHAMIAEARRRSRRLNLPAEFILGDARSMGFWDETFDCTRIDRSLQHISDPLRAIAEMARVTKSGGMIAAFEPDWGTFAISSSNRQVARKILNLFCDNFRSGWVGRHLYSLFLECGIEEVSVDPKVLMITDFCLGDKVWDLARNAYQAQSMGLISKKDADDWLSELKMLDTQGRFFACHSCFLVSGRRP